MHCVLRLAVLQRNGDAGNLQIKNSFVQPPDCSSYGISIIHQKENSTSEVEKAVFLAMMYIKLAVILHFKMHLLSDIP